MGASTTVHKGTFIRYNSATVVPGTRTTLRVPTQGEETRYSYEYKKVPYLSKASFRRINTGYYPKLRKWLPVGQKKSTPTRTRTSFLAVRRHP